MDLDQTGKSVAAAVGDLEALPNLIFESAETLTANVVLYPTVAETVDPAPIVPVNVVTFAIGLVGTYTL